MNKIYYQRMKVKNGFFPLYPTKLFSGKFTFSKIRGMINNAHFQGGVNVKDRLNA
jgi:hypothetical protein